jgi:hypothetical protein
LARAAEKAGCAIGHRFAFLTSTASCSREGMDFIDLWWNTSQQAAIRELRSGLGQAQLSTRNAIARQTEIIRLLEEENDELRVRLGVLIRLLIQKGVLATEEFASAVSAAKTEIAAMERPKVRPPAKKLPKPPKLSRPPNP